MSKKQTDRNEMICKMRKEGKTLQAIATIFNISRERARQLVYLYSDEISTDTPPDA